jgi:Mrp family chromosome partitioning ATPase
MRDHLHNFRQLMLDKFNAFRKKESGGMPFALPREISSKLHQTVLMIERLAENNHYSFALAPCQHHAGTSTLTWSMARTYSEITKKEIAVVEANLHTPILGKVLGLDEKPGFCEFVSGTVNLDGIVQQPEGESFSVITAGDIGSGKKKAISQSDLESALRKIRDRFEITIVDTAPLLIYPDTLSLAGGLDGLILVLKAESDEWEVAKLARKAVSDTGTNILGAILNKRPFHIPDWLYQRI